MDGRIQMPVLRFLQERFGVEYIDNITMPGPDGLLAHASNPALIESVHERIQISTAQHGSVGLSVLGHHDCAGHPVSLSQHHTDTRAAARYLKKHYPSLPVVALWVNENYEVVELETL